jgi:hypothetical protein
MVDDGDPSIDEESWKDFVQCVGLDVKDIDWCRVEDENELVKTYGRVCVTGVV